MLQEAPCIGTECSKSWSVTRLCKETAEKYSDSNVDFMWFMDEKIFTVATSQKSPEWSFVLADCVKKERDCSTASATHTLDFQQVGDDVRRCVKVGTNAADIRRFWSEDQWRILLWCASHTTATACRARDLGRLHLLAARHFFLHATQSNFLNGRHPRSLHQTCGLQQSRSSPDVGRNAAAGLRYRTKVHDLDELKQRLIDVWHGLGQNVIDDAIDEWRKRLRACIRAKGRHFEYLFWLKGTHTITLC